MWGREYRTDPPTAPIGNDAPYPEYEDATEVQYVCERCGSKQFAVFRKEGWYKTYVKCVCGNSGTVHDG